MNHQASKFHHRSTWDFLIGMVQCSGPLIKKWKKMVFVIKNGLWKICLSIQQLLENKWFLFFEEVTTYFSRYLIKHFKSIKILYLIYFILFFKHSVYESGCLHYMGAYVHLYDFKLSIMLFRINKYTYKHCHFRFECILFCTYLRTSCRELMVCPSTDFTITVSKNLEHWKCAKFTWNSRVRYSKSKDNLCKWLKQLH